jgi:hypothetical protein
MYRSFFRRLPAMLAVVVVAMLTLPVSILAAQPVVETFYNEDSFTFAGPCPNGVILEGSFSERLRITTFFDKDGNPIRVQIKIDVSGVVTNPVNGQSVSNPSHQMVTLDLIEGTETVAGLVYSVTVPGVGVAFHDVGRVVFDAEGNTIFEAGPHDVLNTAGDHAVRTRFCEALT